MPRQSIFNADGTAKPDSETSGIDLENRTAVEPNTGAIDPASISATGSSGSAADSGGSGDGGIRPKRKYRKRGSAQTGETLSIEGLAGILYSCHVMLATVSKTPELMLDEKEALELSKASVNVSRHYGFAPSSKSVDWANLIMALGAVYGTRLIAVRNRKRKEPKKGKETTQAEAMDAPIQWPPYPNEHHVNN